LESASARAGVAKSRLDPAPALERLQQMFAP
jgi:hypothetical protein